MLILFRTMLAALAGALLIYAAFVIKIGGAPVAQHILDVWRSPVMQTKLTLTKDELDDRWQKLKAQVVPQPDATLVEFTPDERRALRQLIEHEEAE